MSKKTTFAVVLVALLVAMGAGAFIGSRAGGGATAVMERTALGTIPALAPSPISGTAQAPLVATPSDTVSSMPVATTVTPLMEKPTPPPTPNTTTPQAEETPIGDGTGI